MLDTDDDECAAVLLLGAGLLSGGMNLALTSGLYALIDTRAVVTRRSSACLHCIFCLHVSSHYDFAWTDYNSVCIRKAAIIVRN